MLKPILKWAAIAVPVVVAAVFVFGPGYAERSYNGVADHDAYVISDAARELHADLVIGDLHSDSVLWGRNLMKRASRGHVDVPRLQEGNVALQVFPAVTLVPKGLNYEENTPEGDSVRTIAFLDLWPLRTWNSIYERALFHAERLHDLEARSDGALKIIRTTDDLKRTMADRYDNPNPPIGALISFEGAQTLEGELENVQRLFDAGYRLMELQHFFDNELGGSLHGVKKGGLTDFGREAVAEMERLEIIIDVAHSSEAVVDEVLAMATRPLIVSHTGVKGACDTPRNIPDTLMKRIAAAGGLIGIGFWDAAACDITPAGVVKSIRYAIDLLGVDHVALGSDYDGATTVAFDASEIAVLTHEMLEAGFSEDEIRAVMGGNMLRFLQHYLPG